MRAKHGLSEFDDEHATACKTLMSYAKEMAYIQFYLNWDEFQRRVKTLSTWVDRPVTVPIGWPEQLEDSMVWEAENFTNEDNTVLSASNHKLDCLTVWGPEIL